jgi:threonine aldolase
VPAQREIVDLRSDTITRPTDAMRTVIAQAEVGDDQFGEDPSVNALQAKVATLLGKEAALFMPTGTMVNQVALRTFTRPGDDVIVTRESHAVWHETGASAANSSVQFSEIGARLGAFTADEFVAAIKPRDNMTLPPTTLVEVENTHNRGGGLVADPAQVERICAAARERAITSYLDGARIWNAAIATGCSPADLAAPFDAVGVCLSKGLGAPGGSLLAGRAEAIARAVRYRRMFGGAMRQSGLFAAAGIHALDHHFERLAEDHAHARLIAERLLATDRIDLDLAKVMTNIIVFHLREGAPDAAAVVERARELGVLVFAFGARTVRAVTHLDVTRAQCERGAELLAEAVSR